MEVKGSKGYSLEEYIIDDVGLCFLSVTQFTLARPAFWFQPLGQCMDA